MSLTPPAPNFFDQQVAVSYNERHRGLVEYCPKTFNATLPKIRLDT